MNLHSRIASRVLMRMANRTYNNENDIYDLVLEQPWEDWFTNDHTIRVDITAIKSPLTSLEFTTLKIKDAVCDRFRDHGERLRAAIDATDEAGDANTADIFTAASRGVDKDLWFMESHLEG